MKLCYYAVCRTEYTLDTIYYFTGTLSEKLPLIQTDEGVLYWLNKYDAVSYPMSAHVKEFYLHWLDEPDFNGLYCCLTGCDGKTFTGVIN